MGQRRHRPKRKAARTFSDGLVGYLSNYSGQDSPPLGTGGDGGDRGPSRRDQSTFDRFPEASFIHFPAPGAALGQR